MEDPSHTTPSPRPIIGLAGGIGSGKSLVASMLAELGCLVTDSDAAGRAALCDPQIIRTLREWWGPEVLDEAGQIDRQAVAQRVFNDAAQRKRLESLTHPWIEADRRRQWAEAGEDVVAFVIDAPLLFEAGLDAACDWILFVDTPRATRLERVMRTRGWNEEELARREESQLPLDVKRGGADYVVENCGDQKALAETVHRIFAEIMRPLRSSHSSP